MKKHELLAPAGGKPQLIAAINAGADAVYLGGENFNARVNANNFNKDEVKWALDFAHVRGVKIYITMNTLLSDAEFSGAFEYAKFLYEEGADALIVQDLGLAKQVKKHLPEIELHLSTQGTIYNAEGVKAAKELGFKRIVLARETTLDEICELSSLTYVGDVVTGVRDGAGGETEGGIENNIEIETFVHGALCICYSGQCQMSRHIGGRSGNKGSCAQPCRLPYSSQYTSQYENQLSKNHKDNSQYNSNQNHKSNLKSDLLANHKSNLKSDLMTNHKSNLKSDLMTNHKNLTPYALSPKDLCTVEFLGELCDAGVLSFKIEGRMKSPEYVAIVTSIYRKYLDLAICGKSYTVTKEDRYALNQIFNRGGFTSGYYHGVQNHKKFMSVDMPKHQGVYVGQVHERREGSVFVDVEVLPGMTVNLGDGIEIRSKELTGNVVTYRESLNNSLLRIGDIKGKIEAGDNVYKITDKSLMKEAEVFFANDKDLRKSYINMKFKAKLGEYPELEVFESEITCFESEVACDENESTQNYFGKCVYEQKVRVIGKTKVQKAEKTPTTKEMIIKQLSKTGGTPFAIAGGTGTGNENNFDAENEGCKDKINGINIEIDDGISIPIAELNKLRRDALAALELAKIKSTKRAPVNICEANNISANCDFVRIDETKQQAGDIVATAPSANCDVVKKSETKNHGNISLFFHKGSDATPKYINQKIKELKNNGVSTEDVKIFVPLYDFVENIKNNEAGTFDVVKKIENHNAENTGNKIIPYILNVSKGKLDDYIRANFDRIVDKCKESGILIGNLGWIREFSARGIFVYGDYGLNVTNHSAQEALSQLGMGELASTSIEIHEGSFGKIPLMISEFIFEQDYLIDRKGARYSIIKNEFQDKSIILSEEIPLDYDKIKKLQNNGEGIRIYH